MDAVRAPHFLSRIPLQNFLPLRVVLPLAFASIILATSTSVGEANFYLIATWAAIHTGTVLAAGLIAVVAKAILTARRVETVSVWFVAGMGATAGVAKALSTAGVEASVGLSDQWTDNLAARVIGATLAGVWVFVLSAYAATGFQRLQRARDEIIRKNVATRLRTGHNVHQFELGEPLELVKTLHSRINTDQQMPSSTEIRTIVNSSIRPLSKALWSVENARYPEISLRSLLEASLRSRRIRAGWIALLWTSTAFAGLAITEGMLASAAQNATIGVLGYITWKTSSRFLPRTYGASLIAIAAISTAVVVLGFGLASVLFPRVGLSGDPVELATGSIWMVLSVIGVSIFQGAFEISEMIRHDLDNDKTRALIAQQSTEVHAAEAARGFATQLHGDIQSKLLGIATAIDHKFLSTHAVATELNSVIDSLQLLHDQPADRETSGQTDSLQQRLWSIMDSWRGLVTITLDDESAKRLVRHLEQSPELLEVVREGITNAHKHGLATAVSIVCHDRGVLTITDNGYGPRHGPPGLGSALLDLWGGSGWELTQSGDTGATLRVVLD